MRVFSPDSAGCLWLSPYTRVNVQQDKLIIHQTLFDRVAVLNCPEGFSFQLLNLLSHGAKEEEVLSLLISFMHEEKPACVLIDTWLQIGVFE